MSALDSIQNWKYGRPTTRSWPLPNDASNQKLRGALVFFDIRLPEESNYGRTIAVALHSSVSETTTSPKKYFQKHKERVALTKSSIVTRADTVRRKPRGMRASVPPISGADFVLHSLRHTILNRLGESGVDAFTIMRIAGHSSIVVSQRYVHPSQRQLNTPLRAAAASWNGLGAASPYDSPCTRQS